MKKLVSLMTAMVMVLALTSCGAKPAADTQAAASTPTASSAAAASTPTEASAESSAYAGMLDAPGEVEYEFGDSALFSEEDINAAVALIEAEFATWEGCEMKSLFYTSDEECNEENIAWMNSLADEGAEPFTQCIKFVSNLHTAKDAGGAWEPDTDYNDYEWWLARTEGGEWQLMSWGY
jgi:D-alanyl-D-alanine carboxypeptidase